MSQNSSTTPNSKTEKKKRENTPHKKQPKKITATYLHNSGLYYLQRYAASSGHFREVMLRKIKKSCMAHPEQNIEYCIPLLDELIEKFMTVNLLDDQSYVTGMVNTMRRKGKSAKAIHNHLRNKRVPPQAIEDALASFDHENDETSAETEFKAAIIYARKKRLGPYKGEKEIDPQKELARMARAGFAYDTSRRVLNMNEEEIVEH